MFDAVATVAGERNDQPRFALVALVMMRLELPILTTHRTQRRHDDLTAFDGGPGSGARFPLVRVAIVAGERVGGLVGAETAAPVRVTRAAPYR